MILTYMRTVVLYLILIGMIRLMGKRQLGQLEPSEFVVAILVADLASIPMQDGSIPLLSGLIPILTVLGIELILSALSLRSISFRKLLCGKPVILIENGQILQRNLRRTQLTLDELSGHLREKGVLDVESVQYAILETNGSLSVFPFPETLPASAKDAKIQPAKQFLPITLISDGCLLRKNLEKAKKDSAWLQNVLKGRNATVFGTFLLTVDGADHVCFIPKEECL